MPLPLLALAATFLPQIIDVIGQAFAGLEKGGEAAIQDVEGDLGDWF